MRAVIILGVLLVLVACSESATPTPQGPLETDPDPDMWVYITHASGHSPGWRFSVEQDFDIDAGNLKLFVDGEEHCFNPAKLDGGRRMRLACNRYTFTGDAPDVHALVGRDPMRCVEHESSDPPLDIVFACRWEG